jgi:hypothetical protein
MFDDLLTQSGNTVSQNNPPAPCRSISPEYRLGRQKDRPHRTWLSFSVALLSLLGAAPLLVREGKIVLPAYALAYLVRKTSI